MGAHEGKGYQIQLGDDHSGSGGYNSFYEDLAKELQQDEDEIEEDAEKLRQKMGGQEKFQEYRDKLEAELGVLYRQRYKGGPEEYDSWFLLNERM